MLEVSIRPGQPEDEKYIREFTATTFEWGDYVADAFPTWLKGPGDVWVAQHRERVVGVTHVHYTSNGEAWFEGIRVHPSYRRLGIGRLLTEASISGARKKGATMAFCAIDSTNEASSALARSFGFEKTEHMIEHEKNLAGPPAGGGPQNNGASHDYEIRPATPQDYPRLIDLAAQEVRFIGCNFRWRPVSLQNIAPESSEERVLVAATDSGEVFACAFMGSVWEDPPRKEGEPWCFSVDIGAVFGELPAVSALLDYAETRLWEYGSKAKRSLENGPEVEPEAELRIFVYTGQSQNSLSSYLLSRGFTAFSGLTCGAKAGIGIWSRVL
ncbi:MAG TPA: GNAT family N-acetyltransferase [Firmicutes bacterium]|nr:GNAT family N-acetyltransferase [Candidatus Fermentithermobacillaceae bacterium]